MQTAVQSRVITLMKTTLQNVDWVGATEIRTLLTRLIKPHTSSLVVRWIAVDFGWLSTRYKVTTIQDQSDC